MPSYPIEPDKLLDAADRLAPPEVGPGRPPYTAHRRAASTAYYAAYHAITEKVVELAFPVADPAFRRQVRRWVGHDDIAEVCRWVSALQGTGSYSVPKHISSLLSPAGAPSPIDTATVAIADGFLELKEKREEADYDHEAVFARTDTRTQIALARQVVTLVETADSDEARGFFGLIAMQAKVRAR